MISETLDPARLAALVIPLFRAVLFAEDVPPALAWADVRPHLAPLMAWCERQQVIPPVVEGLMRLSDFAETPEARPLIARAAAFAAYSRLQTDAAEALSRLLEDAKVAHMPLKGLWLKPLYPLPEWRVMGDVDILIPLAERDRVTALLIREGYAEGRESDHEMHWHTPEGIPVELHKSLVPTYDTDLYAYFDDALSRAHSTEGHPYRLRMTAEDTYLYLLAHMAKHYRGGGVGMRYAVDLCLYRRAHAMASHVLDNGLARLGLSVFGACVDRLCRVWFEDATHDETTRRMEAYLLSSGVYGDATRAEVVAGARVSRADGRGGRAGRIRQVLFPSYKTLCPADDSTGRWKLPFLWVARWWQLWRTRRAHSREKFSRLRAVNDTAVADFREELAAVGLNFPHKRT